MVRGLGFGSHVEDRPRKIFFIQYDPRAIMYAGEIVCTQIKLGLIQ